MNRLMRSVLPGIRGSDVAIRAHRSRRRAVGSCVQYRLTSAMSVATSRGKGMQDATVTRFVVAQGGLRMITWVAGLAGLRAIRACKDRTQFQAQETVNRATQQQEASDEITCKGASGAGQARVASRIRREQSGGAVQTGRLAGRGLVLARGAVVAIAAAISGCQTHN